MERLTDQQRQLVTDNHNLIYWFCKKYSAPVNEVYDILAIALVKAAATYKPDNGAKFNTYATHCMYNNFFCYAKRNAEKGLNPWNGNSPEYIEVNVKNNTEEDTFERTNLMTYNESQYEWVEIMAFLPDALSTLTEMERKAVIAIMHSDGKKEAGKKAGISQSYLYRVLRMAKKKIVEACL